MPDLPTITDAVNAIDEVAEVRRHADGSVTMSAVGWAKHRYTMAFLLAIIAAGAFGVVTFLLWKFRADDQRYADLLVLNEQLKGEIALVKSDKDKTEATALKLLVALEGRVTVQERKDENYADAFNGLRSDMRTLMTQVSVLSQDMAVVKAQHKPQ